jgi:hypothetical protein
VPDWFWLAGGNQDFEVCVCDMHLGWWKANGARPVFAGEAEMMVAV